MPKNQQIALVTQSPSESKKDRKQPEFYTFTPVDTTTIMNAFSSYQGSLQKAVESAPHLADMFNTSLEAVARLKSQIEKARLIRLSF